MSTSTIARKRPCRLIVVASHPIQYFTPIYRHLAAEPGLDIEVLFCSNFGVAARYEEQFDRVIQWDTDQLSGYPHRFLRSVSPVRSTGSAFHAVNPGVITRVLRDADAIWVNGWVYPTNWLALAAAKLKGAKVLLRSDFRLDPTRKKRWYERAKRTVVRAWMRWSDGLLYIGAENRRAYESYGARADQLFFSPFSVDVAAIDRAVDDASRPEERNKLRTRWGVPKHACVVLFAGKLIERKQPESLLALAQPGDDTLHVVVAGSGPLEASLKAKVAEKGATNVTFLGFVNQSAIPEVYALADIFVFPTKEEPWGLVLNEAMVAGLAPVVSRAAGAVADLVTSGETGFVFDPADWVEMEALVRRLAKDADLRHRVGSAARQRARDYSYGASARGIVEALTALDVYSPPVLDTSG